MNPIDTSVITNALAPDQPTLSEQVTDRVADAVLEHSKDLATNVILPAAKYTIGAKLVRNRRQLGAVLVGLVLVGAVAGYLKKRSAPDAEEKTTKDIPTISDRTAA